MTVRTQQTIATIIALVLIGALSLTLPWQWWQLSLVAFPILAVVLLLIWLRDKAHARN